MTNKDSKKPILHKILDFIAIKIKPLVATIIKAINKRFDKDVDRYRREDNQDIGNT